jgi:ubiquitin C-terminal hydrolase
MNQSQSIGGLQEMVCEYYYDVPKTADKENDDIYDDEANKTRQKEQQQQQQQQQQRQQHLRLGDNEILMKPDISDANSYRLVGIVSHLGASSNSGHYISDVYNMSTQTWSSYDDNKVETLGEEQVLQKRAKTGYIFFYIHK